MAFSGSSFIQYDSENGAAAASHTLTLSGAPTEGNFLLLVIRGTNEVEANYTPPSGFSLIAKHERASESIYAWGKIAGASEGTSFEVTATSTYIFWSLLREISDASSSSAVGADTDSNTATNSLTIQAGTAAIDATSGSLVIAAASHIGSGLDPTPDSVSDSFTMLDVGDPPNEDQSVDLAYLVAPSTSTYNTTFTYAGTVTRRSSVIFSLLPAGASSAARRSRLSLLGVG